MLSNAFSSVSRSYAARETLFSRTHLAAGLSTEMQRDVVIFDGFPVFERTPKTRDAARAGGVVNNMTADAMEREQYQSGFLKGSGKRKRVFPGTLFEAKFIKAFWRRHSTNY